MRPKIPLQVETALLLGCRRRCCICFGLYKDNRMKQGQIAHLDHSSDNNSLENLAFLCFDHHDQYDSKTSQSKRLTLNEVKEFKNELENHIKDLWNSPVLSDEIKIDIFTGNYYRGNAFEEANLDVTFLGGNKIYVKGLAIYGKNSESGPNIGELDFVAELIINKAKFIDQLFDEEYSMELTFLGESLIVKENLIIGYFGHNAHFGGTYHKIK